MAKRNSVYQNSQVGKWTYEIWSGGHFVMSMTKTTTRWNLYNSIMNWARLYAERKGSVTVSGPPIAQESVWRIDTGASG